MKQLLRVAILLAVAVLSVQAQEESPEKPREGFVRIINAGTVEMREPWRAGVDLSFKDQLLARDMRGGEGAAYKPITFVGKDTVDVRPTGQKIKIGSVPASFEKGGFYTILLTGVIADQGFNVSPIVSTDFPVPPGKARQGYARVNVFNGVTTFPVRMKAGEDALVKLDPLAFSELYLKSGTHPYSLLFPYKGQEREMQGLLIVGANSEYTAVIFASPEKPDRPVLRLWDNSQQRRDVLEAAEAAKKKPEKPKSESAGG